MAVETRGLIRWRIFFSNLGKHCIKNKRASNPGAGAYYSRSRRLLLLRSVDSHLNVPFLCVAFYSHLTRLIGLNASSISRSTRGQKPKCENRKQELFHVKTIMGYYKIHNKTTSHMHSPQYLKIGISQIILQYRMCHHEQLAVRPDISRHIS